MGAVAIMAIPPMSPSGVRQTVNAGLTPAQTTWNLRSALNVAALNCLDPQYTGLVENYGTYLTNNAKQLSATNRALQAEFRQKYGATFRDVQDSYMTQVYNYYALPPAKNLFCDVAYQISLEALTMDPANLDAFSATALQRVEAAFEQFFAAYEDYRTNVAAWDAEYGPPPEQTMTVGYDNPLDPGVASTTGAVTVAEDGQADGMMSGSNGVPQTIEATGAPASEAQGSLVLPGEEPETNGGLTLPDEQPQTVDPQ